MSDAGAPIPVERLLDQANWVRRLAHRLVSDDADAEDLVQETWLAAVKSPPQPSGDTKSWLRRVMKNALLQRRRAEGARLARETAVVRERPEAVAPDEVVERAEMQREMVGLVLALEEPYRSTVLLRHFEELLPAAIAERMGVPVNTVNSRLKRAHDLLRERLERRHGAEWRVALLPLLGWPEPLGAARAAGAARGARVRRLRWAAAVCVVVAAGGAAGFFAAGNPPAAPVAASSAETAGVPAGSGSRSARTEAASADEARVEPAEGAAVASSPAEERARDASRIAVTLTLRTEAGEVPDDVEVRITPLFARATGLAGAPTTTRASAGSVTVDLAAFEKDGGDRVAEWKVAVDDPRWLPAEIRVRAPLPSEEDRSAHGVIALRPAAIVTGSVAWDAAPGDEPGWVGSAPLEATGVTALETARIRPGERFRLRVAPGRPFLAIAAAQGRVPASAEVELAPGAEKDVGVLTLAEGAWVRGSVRRPKVPLPEASASRRVAVYSQLERNAYNVSIGPLWLTHSNGTAWFYGTHAEIAADGTFAVGGLPPGPVSVDLQALGAGLPAPCVRRTVTAPADGVDFVMDGALVRALVRRDGSPVADAGVTLATPDGTRIGARTGPDGWANVLAAPDTSYLASASLKGHTSSKVPVVGPALDAPAAEVTIDLTPVEAPTSTWTITLAAALGDAPTVAGFGFHAVKDGKAFPFPAFVRDARDPAGVFRLDAIPAGRWRVSIRPGATWHDPGALFTAADLEREVAAGAAQADTVPVAPAGRAFVDLDFPRRSVVATAQCRVLDTAGAETPVVFARRQDTLVQYSQQPSFDGPSDVFPALAPGRYVLDVRAWRDGVETVRAVPFEVAAGRVTRVPVDLR